MADVVVLPSKGESEVSEAIVVSACLIGMFTRIGKGGRYFEARVSTEAFVSSLNEPDDSTSGNTKWQYIIDIICITIYQSKILA